MTKIKNKRFSLNNPVYNLISLDRKCFTLTQVSTVILNQSGVSVHQIICPPALALMFLDDHFICTAWEPWSYTRGNGRHRSTWPRMCRLTEVPSFVHWTSDKTVIFTVHLSQSAFVSAPFMNNTHTHTHQVYTLNSSR